MINTKRPAPVSTATLPVLMDAIAAPGATAASIAEAVSHDSGLAARVLGLANSAQFGMSRRVSRLDMAVGLVGTAMVQTLAIASAAALIDRDGVMAGSQIHSFEVGTAAKLLAPAADVRPSDAFAAGLLHDVGELLLLQAKPTEYAAMRAGFESHAHQLRVEHDHFGTDHALVGAEHLLDWRVPDVIVDAVADHHRPLAGSPMTTIVVAAADELVDADPDRRDGLVMLGIDPDAAEGLRNRVVEDAAALVGLLG